MNRFTLLAMLILLAACTKSTVTAPTPPPPPKVDPYVVGALFDSLTSASRLSRSPWWNLYIVVVGADANHSGVALQGSIAQAYQPPSNGEAVCLGGAGQVVGERLLAYVALGDTLYSADSAAYWSIVARLGIGADAARILIDSAVAGQLNGRLPGGVALTTGLFDPTVSTLGRGATPQTAIIKQWTWTNAGRTFIEVSPSAATQPCLN